MTRYLRRLARWLIGRDDADRVRAEADGWFAEGNASTDDAESDDDDPDPAGDRRRLEV